MRYLSTSLIPCASIALATLLVSNYLWFLGPLYLNALTVLAIVHLVASTIAFVDKTNGLMFKCGVVILLLIGQLWAIEMIYMQIIWRINGFV